MARVNSAEGRQPILPVIAAAVLAGGIVIGCGGENKVTPPPPPPPPPALVLQAANPSGNLQTGLIEQALPLPLRIIATRGGVPAGGEPISWTTQQGSLSGSQSTGADGIASATWTLGSRSGSQAAKAMSGNQSVSFTANGTKLPVVGTVSGTIRDAFTLQPIAQANIAIGNFTDQSDQSGHYELQGVSGGRHRMQLDAPGYVEDFADVTVISGLNPVDLDLWAAVRYSVESGGFSFALYLPDGVAVTSAVLLAMGGPNTRAMIFPFEQFGAPDDDTEAGLRAFTDETRYVAALKDVAIVGMSDKSITDIPDVRQAIWDGLDALAVASGHPELSTAPVLTIGLSAGGPISYSMALRNPSRAVGVVLKVPSGLDFVDTEESRSVPVLGVSGTNDHSSLDPLTASFYVHRAAGALWALASEPDAGHFTWTDESIALIGGWMEAILGSRLPISPGGPLRPLVELSGWVGDLATGVVTAADQYTGNPLTAAWLPTAQVATLWHDVVSQ